jgi:hypothetical protein
MLVKGTSWLSRAIQTATKSPYSHVAFMMGDITYEADSPGGVQSRYVKGYPWPYDLYRIDGLDADKAVSLHGWCTEQLCKNPGYDYGKVIGLGLDMLLHACGFRSLLDSQRTFTCSEFICDGLHSVGIELKVGQAMATPASISRDPLIHQV